MSLLAVQDIHTYYGDCYVLQGISLEVPKGSVVALLGRNGMGKTTLIRSVVGLTTPRSGSVIFKGIDVTPLPNYRKALMGMGLVPHSRHCFRYWHVEQFSGLSTG